MPTFASALAYQGLFALFPFVIFVGLLLVVLQVDGFFDRLIEQARSSLPEEALAPVAERLLRQGQEVAESNLVPFGIVFFAVWSASGVAWTLLEALNVVHQVEETRPLWKRFAILIVFAPAIGVMVILGAGLLLIGPQLAEWLAGRIGLNEAFVTRLCEGYQTRQQADAVAQFPMNDPPAREGRTPIAPGKQIDTQFIRQLAFVNELWPEPCPYLAVGPRNRQHGSRLGMPLGSSDPGVTSL